MPVTDPEAAVLRAVDDDVVRMVAALAALVRIPSLTGSAGEHEALALLATDLAADGLEVDHWALPLAELRADPDFPGTEVDRDEAWGVVGRLAGTGGGASLMLNGHVDVVPPGDPSAWSGPDPFSGRIEGGAVHGRGACDMKGGVIAARWAVRALRAAGVPLRGDVLVAPVGSEEDGGLGTFGLLRRGWRAGVCVVPEPTGLDIVPACAGALTFRLRVRGRSAHASRRTDGVSAIGKLWPVWSALAALERRRNRAVDPLMDRWPIAYPLSIGTVRAGDWASSVPDLLEAEGRLGVALGEATDGARVALEAAVAEACAGDPWLRDHPVEVEWWGGQFASGRLPAGHDLADRVAAAHARVSPSPVATWGAPYGSDLRLLAGLGGIPTVHYGPGDSALAHAPDERVPIAEVHTAARALALLALDVCGVGGGG
ncbi:MAG TPA: ArgE/DapE family deacylase [Acidimicrobiales bacterium]|nr:ArgE/DapE family deacylase [Acidimicrobiales bacterium]